MKKTSDFRRGSAYLLLGASLLGSAFLGGCATTSGTMQKDVGYEQFYDSQGDYKLVGKNNDIYLEKLDGSESRQVTHTPNVKERAGYFTKTGNYIIYWDETTPDGYGAYLVKTEEDDSKRIRISEDEGYKIMYEKIK